MRIDNPDKVFQSLEMTEWVSCWENKIASDWSDFVCNKFLREVRPFPTTFPNVKRHGRVDLDIIIT